MVQIYCYNWNLYLPPEGIFDSTCGYHALRNGNEMLSILNINDYKIDDNYISNLKNNSDKLKSKVDLFNDIQIYKNQYNSNFLSRTNLKLIKENLNLNSNIFIIYLDVENIFDFEEKYKLEKILKNKSYKICFIYFKEFIGVTHWVSLVIDKQEDKAYVHILDSYDYSWYGDKTIDKLINMLYPINSKINCQKDIVKGRFLCFSYKSTELLFLVISIYIFINGLFLRFDIKKNIKNIIISLLLGFVLFYYLYLYDFLKINYKFYKIKYLN